MANGSLLLFTPMATERPQRDPIRRPPTCNCVLLCDDLLESKVRGKHTLVGVIGAIVVAKLPAIIGPYICYVRLANLTAKKEITLQLTEANTGDLVLEMKAQVPEQDHPLGVCTIVATIPPVALDKAGRYLFSAVHDGVSLAETPIQVILPTATEEQP